MKTTVVTLICTTLLRSLCNGEVVDIFSLKITGGRIEIQHHGEQEHLIWRDENNQRHRLYTLVYPLQSGVVESPKGDQVAFITGSKSLGTWPIVVNLGAERTVARAPLGTAEGEGMRSILESARASGVTNWSENFPVAPLYARIAGWTKEGDWLFRVKGDGDLREFGVRVSHNGKKINHFASDALPPKDVTGLSVVSAFTSYSGSGTGFFISDEGLLVTTLHVVENAARVRVDFDGRSYEASGVGFSRMHDLHLLKIEPTDPTPYLRLSDVVPGQLGERCFTVGYPLTSIQGFAQKFTEGSISSLSGVEDDPNSLQISVPVQAGNSGGALISESGGVLGVIQSRLSNSETLKLSGDLPQNVNYAIKVSALLRLIHESNVNIPQDPAASQTREESIAAAQSATVRVIVYK